MRRVLLLLVVSAVVAGAFAAYSNRTVKAKAETRVPEGLVYYVSTTGKDSNPGTSDAPWRNPGYASRHMKAGSTLIIRGGRYVIDQYDDDIMDPPSGTSAAWTTVMGEEGHRPVIAGRDDLLCAMLLAGKKYVRVKNIEVTHDSTVTGAKLRFRVGISMSGKPSSHIALESLYIHHIDEMALDIQDVDDLSLIDCRFEYCGFGAIGGPAGEHGGIRNLRIRGCELSYSGHYYQGTGGRDRPYDRPDGFGIEASAGPVEIERTTAQHNRGDGLDSKAANTYIHECIVANNSCDGIKLWQGGSRIVNCLVYGTGDGIGGPSSWAGIVIEEHSRPNASFEIVNVTLEDNPTRENYPIYVQYGIENPIKLLMRNTIIANGYGIAYFGPSVKLTCDHSLFYRPNEEAQVEANGREYSASELGLLGAGNISAKPQFVKSAWGTTGDYHLKPGSPGLGAGSAVGAPATDLDNKPRSSTGECDMGAYQH